MSRPACRIRKYLGSYLLQFGGNLDALVFSAGVGENSAQVRQLVCEGLEVGAGALWPSKPKLCSLQQLPDSGLCYRHLASKQMTV